MLTITPIALSASQLNPFQQLGMYIQTIGLSDLLDVAIIAVIFYYALKLVQKSQTGQVFRGVALVVVLLWLSDLFNLHVLNFLLNSVVQVGFLALIVVFQPEIRHFLTQVGTGNLRHYLRRQEETSVVEDAIVQTVAAYQDMSRKKVGALTVFERNSLLTDCLHTGTALDAALSSDLLENIFYPKAPLHDGAVIVREGRIVGAGCVLPLSGNTNISKELGTRHRAGLGVTEHTDAVVVICSEETGSISVATDGMLKRHLSAETLEQLLRNELLTEEQNKKTLIPSLRTLLGSIWKKEDEDHVE
ncbi:MAG: diadenylate cyclase CdaA [Clostridiales bacterium]|nr:diadenylate cyclase CdaA [Clostridiales bacterium]MCD7880349.1 diadenylate cyclase CdaA [Clostridiales bacterium]